MFRPVDGGCGDFAGINRIAGTVLVFGPCGLRPAAGMPSGTLALFADETSKLLPTFLRGGRFQPLILQLLLRQLKSLSFVVPEECLRSDYVIYIFHGDLVADGRGEILLRAAG